MNPKFQRMADSMMSGGGAARQKASPASISRSPSAAPASAAPALKVQKPTIGGL